MWLNNAAHLMTKGLTEVLGVTHACMPMSLHECAASCAQAAHTAGKLLREAALSFRSTTKACTCSGIVVSDSHKHIAIAASYKLSSMVSSRAWFSCSARLQDLLCALLLNMSTCERWCYCHTKYSNRLSLRSMFKHVTSRTPYIHILCACMHM